MDQDPVGWIRTQWDGSGPSGMDQDPAEWIRFQDPAEWIRGPWEGLEAQWMDQSPVGWFRKLLDRPGPRRTNHVGQIRTHKMNKGPSGPWHRRMNQGLAGQIMARRERSVPHGTNQGPAGWIFTGWTMIPQDESGPCLMDDPSCRALIRLAGPSVTDHGPAGLTRAPQDESGPREQSRTRKTNRCPENQSGNQDPRDEPRPRKMNQDPSGRARTPRDELGSRRTS